MGVQIAIPGGWLGVDWNAVTAIATVVAGFLAVWAVRATYREMGRAEARHREQLSAQVRPLLQIRRVAVNRVDRSAIPQLTTENIGVGPARGINVRVWFVPLPAPVSNETLSALSDAIEASPSQYPNRLALIGGLRSNGGEAVTDLAGDALNVTIPAGHQLVAHWKGTCRDTFLTEHRFAGSLNVVDERGHLVTGDSPVVPARGASER